MRTFSTYLRSPVGNSPGRPGSTGGRRQTRRSLSDRDSTGGPVAFGVAALGLRARSWNGSFDSVPASGATGRAGFAVDDNRDVRRWGRREDPTRASSRSWKPSTPWTNQAQRRHRCGSGCARPPAARLLPRVRRWAWLRPWPPITHIRDPKIQSAPGAAEALPLSVFGCPLDDPDLDWRGGLQLHAVS
jgi:hypothetical protein